jgi:hypothetical protein
MPEIIESLPATVTLMGITISTSLTPPRMAAQPVGILEGIPASSGAPKAAENLLKIEG